MTEEELQALRESNPQDPNLPENQNSGPTELELLRETVAETNRRARYEETRNRELSDELTRYKAQQNTPVQKSFSAEEFFANPQALLAAEVSNQIKPLVEFSKEMQRERSYNQLKGRFLSDSRYNPIVTQLGYSLDQVMSQMEPTEMNMVNAINTLIGQAYINNPSAFQQNNNNNQKPKEEVVPANIPAHLRPSNNKVNTQQRVETKEYTENEKRLMRENKMDEAQWEAFLNAPSSLKTIERKK